MHILMTGGTGFVGQELVPYLTKLGHNITIVTRNKSLCDGIGHDKRPVTYIRSFDEIDDALEVNAIINLAGENIASKRWDKVQKHELVQSRVNSTQAIIALVERLNNKPECLISASAIGYYGSRRDAKLHENSEPHDGFTHQLCKEWEQVAQKVTDHGVRLCIARIGVVLGKNGGALSKMLPPFKMGLGGVVGSGEQYFSWIHRSDLVKILEHLMAHHECEGVYNATAPNPVTNRQLTKSLGKNLTRPTIFPMPALVVKCLFGEMGEELLLSGQRVIPQRLTEEVKFEYSYPTIDEAIGEVVS